MRTCWILALASLLVSALAVPIDGTQSAKAQTYCERASHENDPECYCLKNPREEKCLKFLGSNPGFSTSGPANKGLLDGKAPVQQQQLPPVADAATRPSDYTLFIHYGSKTPSNQDVSTLVSNLKREGFLVRGADPKRDEVGGPGVDYFQDEDEAGATKIAELVNKWLPEGATKLKARRQRVRNPAGFIGVWIF